MPKPLRPVQDRHLQTMSHSDVRPRALWARAMGRASGRARVGVLALHSRAAEFFGLWGLAVKLASIAGPLTYGMTSWVTGDDHRQSRLASGSYFLVGLVLLCGVNPVRGRRAALRSDRLSRRGNVPNR